jgi:heme exporter protein B
LSALGALLRRETALAFGRGGGAVQAGAFFVGLAALTPLAAGPEPARLAAAAPGVAFAALALASLLSLERLFERDFEDGALDLLAVGEAPLEAICAVKCIAQWLAGGLLLAVLAPVVAVALGAPVAAAPALLIAALLASLGFMFTGGVGAALALGSRRGGLLIAVVVLPLYAPPVIFGGGAAHAVIVGLPAAPAFLFLAAYSLIAAALAPFAMAAACRNALD